ncbi:hypothetical protein Tco_1218721 [Tanacetum coccineum]
MVLSSTYSTPPTLLLETICLNKCCIMDELLHVLHSLLLATAVLEVISQQHTTQNINTTTVKRRKPKDVLQTFDARSVKLLSDIRAKPPAFVFLQIELQPPWESCDREKKEVELWLENSGSVDSLVSLENKFEEEEEEEEDDLEYFDTFPFIEELGYHKWLLKNPRPSRVNAKESGLVYNKDEGTIIFEKDNEKITFKMPHKMERFKHIDIEDIKTDNIPPFVIAIEDSDLLLKGPRTTPKTSSTHVPQAYTKVISPLSHVYKTLTSQPKVLILSLSKMCHPDPKHKHLKPFQKLRVQGYMAAHTKRMERFKKSIFKQREEINDRMAEMFRILRELTTSGTPKKVLVREEASNPIANYVYAISLVKMEKDKSIKNNEVVNKNVVESSELNVVEPIELVDKKKKMDDRLDDESVRSMKEELTGWETKADVLVKMPRS